MNKSKRLGERLIRPNRIVGNVSLSTDSRETPVNKKQKDITIRLQKGSGFLVPQRLRMENNSTECCAGISVQVIELVYGNGKVLVVTTPKLGESLGQVQNRPRH